MQYSLTLLPPMVFLDMFLYYPFSAYHQQYKWKQTYSMKNFLVAPMFHVDGVAKTRAMIMIMMVVVATVHYIVSLN